MSNDCRIDKYERNRQIHGCGYYSVCFEAGFACPCSPDANVNKGYNPQTWDSMKRESDKLVEEMENEPFYLDDLDDDPYEDFDWEYD